mmetsp:Transcript_1671/g.4773  ORF Transcript_1671/g.4773 Transcript_1671/m.4773 type:complete len:352 (+) Transcript_1671:265-1320(+)
MKRRDGNNIHAARVQYLHVNVTRRNIVVLESLFDAPFFFQACCGDFGCRWSHRHRNFVSSHNRNRVGRIVLKHHMWYDGSMGDIQFHSIHFQSLQECIFLSGNFTIGRESGKFPDGKSSGGDLHDFNFVGFQREWNFWFCQEKSHFSETGRCDWGSHGHRFGILVLAEEVGSKSVERGSCGCHVFSFWHGCGCHRVTVVIPNFIQITGLRHRVRRLLKPHWCFQEDITSLLYQFFPLFRQALRNLIKRICEIFLKFLGGSLNLVRQEIKDSTSHLFQRLRRGRRKRKLRTCRPCSSRLAQLRQNIISDLPNNGTSTVLEFCGRRSQKRINLSARYRIHDGFSDLLVRVEQF